MSESAAVENTHFESVYQDNMIDTVNKLIFTPDGIVHTFQIEKLAKALADAQGSLKKAKKSGYNTHYRNHYSTLSDCIEAHQKAFSKNGLSIIQTPSNPLNPDGNKVCVTTMLMHESGQWLRASISFQLQKVNIQDFGSIVSYLKRYQLTGIAGVSENDQAQIDDDGVRTIENENKGNYKGKQPQKPAQTPPPQQPPAKNNVHHLNNASTGQKTPEKSAPKLTQEQIKKSKETIDAFKKEVTEFQTVDCFDNFADKKTEEVRSLLIPAHLEQFNNFFYARKNAILAKTQEKTGTAG